ncbi:MAG: hypothetical protein ACFFED_05950 [Candidatus Thorarchaeota archaeon]
MESVDLAYWLLRNAGPSIRYRTYVDIFHEQDIGLVWQALSELTASPLIHEWLQRLVPGFGLNLVHSSRPHAYENVMGKLVQLGLRAGLQSFDNKTLPFRAWLSDNLNSPPDQPHAIFLKTVIASFLSYAGYGNIHPVSAHLIARLSSLYAFSKEPDYESIFVDRMGFKGIPKTLESYNLVNPELYPEQHLALPWIYDIRGLAFCTDIMQSSTLRKQAETVVKMILTEEYQSLPRSYGIAKYGDRYYVLGWSTHLPNYRQRPTGVPFAELILSLEMLAPFDCTRTSSWFQDSMGYLEEFRTDDGTYKFPRDSLPEKMDGYWVGGYRMGLEEKRRSEIAIECESTFWMLRIKTLAGTLQARF